MVRLLGAALVSLALALTSPFALRAVAHSHPSVTMHVATGYSEQYRDSAWVPIRVTLHNVTANNLSGTLEIPDSLNNNGQNNNGQGYQGPPQPFTAQYETPVVLPAGATKQVTLYVPGSDIGGQTHVRFRSGGRVLANSYTQPTSFTDSDASIGALVNDPANATWLRHVSSSLVTVHTIQLTSGSLSPVAEALANFDIIVLTNTDTARLDNDQLVALNRYVRNGGSLILVGGPSWQSTLHSLPSTLLPGKLTGSRTLPNLSGLSSLGAGTPPARPTVVSVLTHPAGKVLASERNVPLVVQEGLGSGQIVYLAFDPAVDPIAHWSSRSNLLTRIITRAAPLAMSRAAHPSNITNGPTPFMNPYGPPSDIASELANVPAAALPSILLFFFLTVLYVLLLGPANFFTLRRLKRRELAWVTVPAIALLCVGATFGVAYHLKGNTVLLNTVSVVQLNGNTDQHPASLYVGLFAPVQGDYHLTYHAPALASILPQFQYGGPGPQGHPLGLRFQEGGDTNVTFASMNMWSMRSVALHTWVRFPGGVQTHLHLNARGDIVGTVHNGTQLPLVRPVIMAGDTVTHLHDLPAGSTINVHVRPGYDIHAHNYQPVWYQAYGHPFYSGYMGRSFGFGVPTGGGVYYGGPNYSYCCPGPSPAQEKTLAQRIRNTAAMLPDIQTISSLGEVTFAAWSQQPLDTLTVDGTVPSRRNLDLLVMPVSVGLPQGPFHLRPGTLGATLVDDSPEQPLSGCCSRPMTQQSIFLGSGGWATFSFSVPHSGRVHFRRLTLSVDAGGADGTNIGHVYDWRTRKWVHVNLHYADARLPNPDRFVSPSGTVLVKLAATDSSRDIGISDPHQALQLSGTGVVG